MFAVVALLIIGAFFGIAVVFNVYLKGKKNAYRDLSKFKRKLRRYCGFLLFYVISASLFYYALVNFGGDESNEQNLVERSPNALKLPIPVYRAVPAWAKFEVNLRVTSRKKLAGCLIEKNMSSIMVAVLCFFERPVAFKQANRTVTTDTYFTRFCTDNEYLSYESWLEATKTKFEEWSMFALVRDPLERFISMFVDNNLQRYQEEEDCYGCYTNLTCFVHQVYNRTMDFAISHGQAFYPKMEDGHLFPQNWYCNFRDYIQHYRIVKFSSKPEKRQDTYKHLTEIFLSAGIEGELVDDMLRDVTQHSTNHTTINSPETRFYQRELVEDKSLLDLIYAVYYFDYVLFDFPFDK